MLATRIWSPNLDIDWQEKIGSTIRFPRPVEKRARDGFRLSLFWSMYLAVDGLMEVELDQEILESSYWSASSSEWYGSPLWGYRNVQEMRITKLLGYLTENSVTEIFEQLRKHHTAMISSTPFITELTNNKQFKSCGDIYKFLNAIPGSRRKWSEWDDTTRRVEIIRNQLALMIQYSNPEWIKDRKNLRCYPHLMGAFMRPQLTAALEAFYWATAENPQLPTRNGSLVNKDYIKNYRDTVNNLVLASLES